MNTLSHSYKIVILFIVLILSSCGKIKHVDFVTNKSETYQNAAVVTAHPEASDIGLKILKMGGNAIDAAIATHFALAVCYPVAGNIGGGGFMIYRSKDGETATLDFREMAPSAAYETMYQDQDGNVKKELSKKGHLASGVPGSVAGMYEAFHKYSKLKDWSKLVDPAVQLAKNGFEISSYEANRLNKYRQDFSDVNISENVFLSKQFWKPSDLLIQSELAATLERIRDNGKDGFYQGLTADLIVSEMKKGGGIITKEDLMNYKCVWREPIKCDYEDLTIISMPPPSSGGIALCQLLEMTEPYDLRKTGFQSPENIHLMIEAERRAYADRTKHLGDADFYPVPVASLLDSSYLIERMANFSPSEASSSDEIQEGKFDMESEETTHYSIVDQYGNAVSITTTINTAYGSKVVVGGAGFFLNNEMDDFSAKPGVPNYFGLLGAEANKIEAGKRMLSSMTPTIVEKNGALKLVVGTPGGSTIITSVFQTILNSLVFDMPLKAAVHEERFHHQWKPNLIYHEKNCFDDDLKMALKQKGHKLKERGKIGKVEAILINGTGGLEAVADWRGDDDAKGF